MIQERKKKMALENQRESFEINGGGERKMNFLNLLLEKQKIYKFSDVDIRYEVDTILMAVRSLPPLPPQLLPLPLP